MFDAATAQLLRSAPGVPGLNPQNIPALLTRHYANLVSARLRGTAEEQARDEEWPLERIADTYELTTSIHTDGALRRSSAFVAGTAQQILARRQEAAETENRLTSNINRDRVDPAVAAALLFLAAEQYADANEAASAIRARREAQAYEATILSESIADLARGQLGRILERGQRWRRPRAGRDLEERALAALLETLITGVEMLAASILALPALPASAGRFDSARDALMRVLELSAAFDHEHAAELGGAFRARQRLAGEEFEEKISALKNAIARETAAEVDNAIAELASQSGLSMGILAGLKKKVSHGTGSLPTTVDQWLAWTVDWLAEDENARASLLYDVKRAVLGACGAKKDGELTSKELEAILPGLRAWIQGKPLAEIEKQLGGDPNSSSSAKRICPRTRELVGSVIPRGFSFIMGLVSHVVEEVDPFGLQEDLSRQLLECLGTAVRKGFNSPEKVSYATQNPGVLSRVQAHRRFALG